MWNTKKAEEFMKKAGAFGSVLGLNNMQKLMEELGNIQEELLVIHVAGTNGKGSTCAMLERILCLSGYKTGRYSSPAVFRSEEKYQINGVPIEKETFEQILREIACACEQMEKRGLPHPTLFEIETAAAFLWFYRERCQMVIMETGLGGSLDATNIIRKPLCSVITSVSMDHMAFLGNTQREIAKQKAGIIKEGCPVVSALQQPETAEVLRQVCEKNHSKLMLVEEAPANLHYEGAYLVFDWKQFHNLRLSLLGACQPGNAVCVMEIVRLLNQKGYGIREELVRQGLEETKWPGRFEVLMQRPLVVIDGAHNEDAAQKLRETLEMGFTNRKIIYIIGVLADKEHEKMLQCLLPLASQVYTITPDNPRALSGEDLCREAGKYHNQVEYVPELRQAWERAFRAAQKEDMILAFGSLSYLGELKKEIEKGMNYGK